MKKRHAFTLVELLVVIAIIAVLLGILLPSLSRMRATGQRLQCGTKLSGIGKAVAMYTSDYDSRLPLLEFFRQPTNWTQARFIPSIETPSLVNKWDTPPGGTPRLAWRHLG
ncbi:MAG TPA: type II secretion system protein, partial [Sedimentisphaerales bacterium]|nr:type II secretion system protein [Sedimentisphaerales bacterium]